MQGKVESLDKAQIVSLISRLKHKEDRESTGLYFIEGARMVGDAILNRAPISAIVVSPEMCPDKDVLPVRWADLTCPAFHVSRRQYVQAAKPFALKQGPQGIGALVRQQWVSIEKFRPPTQAIVVALSSVQDPGNVGTIIRTCDAVGCSAIAFIGDCADPYGLLVIRASVGAVFTQTFMKTDFDGLMRMALRTKMQVIGTSPAAPKGYRNITYPSQFALLMGNEAKGLNQREIERCHQTVRIPMVGSRDSLNVAVAASVVLYEAFSQSVEECEELGDSTKATGRLPG